MRRFEKVRSVLQPATLLDLDYVRLIHREEFCELLVAGEVLIACLQLVRSCASKLCRTSHRVHTAVHSDCLLPASRLSETGRHVHSAVHDGQLLHDSTAEESSTETRYRLRGAVALLVPLQLQFVRQVSGATAFPLVQDDLDSPAHDLDAKLTPLECIRPLQPVPLPNALRQLRQHLQRVLPIRSDNALLQTTHIHLQEVWLWKTSNNIKCTVQVLCVKFHRQDAHGLLNPPHRLRPFHFFLHYTPLHTPLYRLYSTLYLQRNPHML
mmetsp:Transcript_10936/g.33537  ORF Transcript_10936/g.33537 Transcript_10936/m.33537 type:complete len:267 (-) Transcript_10936:8-808(-)